MDFGHFLTRLGLAPPGARLDHDACRRLFLEPRNHGGWLEQPVADSLLEEAWNLARCGPTCAGGSPLRLVVLRTPGEKAPLLPLLDQSNHEKTRQAPVVLILAHDVAFWRQLGPHADAAVAWFRHDPDLARETALRNGTLQAAYLIVALHAVGLDVEAMSGFDMATMNRTFFAGTTLEANFVCHVGYGDASRMKPRLPRLAFTEIVRQPVGGKENVP